MLPALPLLAAAMTQSCTIMWLAGIPFCGNRTALPTPEEDVAVAVHVDTIPPGAPVAGVGATGFFRVQARYGYEDGLYLNDENGYRDWWDHLQLGPAPEGWWSNYWIFTREGTGEYRIENRWTGKRLIVRNVQGLAQLMLFSAADIAQIQANWQQLVDTARRQNRPTPSPEVYATTFKLEPRSVGGLPCFRLGWSGGGMYMSNEYGGVSMRTVQDDWWSACWILRSYPAF